MNFMKLILALVLASTLAACGGNPVKNAARLNSIKATGQDKGVYYGWRIKVPTPSAADLCREYAGDTDERCQRPGDFKVEKIVIIENELRNGLGLTGYPILMPVAVDVSVDDIVKFHTDGRRIGFFDAIVGHTRSVFYSGPEELCYREGIWGKNSAANGGIVCPSVGYDYKNLSIWKDGE